MSPQIVQGLNDLATLRPDLLETWSTKNSEISPHEVGVNSHKFAIWIENCGHEFEMEIVKRTSRPRSCKICSGQQLLKGFNDLSTTNPELISEWDFERNGDIEPSTVQKGSGVEVWWKDDLGHSWKAKVSSRTRKQGTACPICRNLKVVKGINDLGTTHEEIAKEFDFELNKPLTPHEIVAGSERKVWWNCSEGHQYFTSPYQKTVKKTGCPVCSNKLTVQGVNDLETTHPKIAAEWDYTKNHISPKEFSAGTHKKAWFICSKKHSYYTVIRKRIDGNNCPYCGNKKLLEGYNDLFTEFPHIAESWDFRKNNKKPDEFLSGSLHQAWFLCDLGHSYKATIQNRTRLDSGCPYCANKKVLKGYNDLKTRSPLIAESWHPSKNSKSPDEYTFGSHSYAWFLCESGHEWRSTIVGRQKSGCPTCASYGFKPNKPAIFYFIENESLNSRKVGITNLESRNVRLRSYQFKGWKKIMTLQDESGERILQLEKTILQWIRKELMLDIYLGSSEMGRLGGWTETFEKTDIPNEVIAKRIYQVAEELGIRKVE